MITPVAVMGDKIKTVCTCVLSLVSLSSSRFIKDHHQDAVASGFFIAPIRTSNGAITQPLQMLVRQMQIKTVSRACISWVSIPRGREKPSYIGCCASDVVNRDKRENLSPVDKTVDNLPTRAFVGCFVYA